MSKFTRRSLFGMLAAAVAAKPIAQALPATAPLSPDLVQIADRLGAAAAVSVDRTIRSCLDKNYAYVNVFATPYTQGDIYREIISGEARKYRAYVPLPDMKP